MSAYYYAKLSTAEQRCYHKLLDGVRQGDTLIRVTPLIKSEIVANVVAAVNYDHPELFYVDFRHMNLITALTGVTYQVNYYMEHAQRVVAVDALERKIAAIVNCASGDNLKNSYEKCRWIHNYLVRNVRYHYEALSQPDSYPDSFGISGVFHNKLAVCEGISKAFKILCDRMGVDAWIVFGSSSFEGLEPEVSHAWNIVCLKEQVSHIDVTWDINLSVTSKHTRFDYFCLPDRCMKKDHLYYGLPECKVDSFTYFCRRNRWFSNAKQLRDYLESELKNGNRILYFKVEPGKKQPRTLAGKIQDQVEQTVLAYYNTCIIEMILNESQICFFFRIKAKIEGENHER